MFLETKRLILRKFREEDFPAFWDYANDPEMSRMMGRNDMSDEVQARATFDWLKDKEPRGYALVLRETGKVIGNLTVGKAAQSVAEHERLTGKHGCSLSFSISKAYQRQGLMFEAVSAVLNRLLWEEKQDYVNCGYLSFNEASRCLQEKLGFSYLLSESFEVDGEELTAIENGILRENFRMEHSCGAVVFTRKNGEILYVIEQMRLGHHDFPKGHVEPAETERETALREIFEEVGLRPGLLEGFREEVVYIVPQLRNTAKTVTYFLGEYEDQRIHTQEQELNGAELLTYEQAMEVLEYEDSREILRKANTYLNNEHRLS